MMALLPGGAGYSSLDLGKHAVYLTWGRRGPDREVYTLPLVAQVCGRFGSAEAPQDQVIFCVVLHILDGFIL